MVRKSKECEQVRGKLLIQSTFNTIIFIFTTSHNLYSESVLFTCFFQLRKRAYKTRNEQRRMTRSASFAWLRNAPNFHSKCRFRSLACNIYIIPTYYIYFRNLIVDSNKVLTIFFATIPSSEAISKTHFILFFFKILVKFSVSKFLVGRMFYHQLFFLYLNWTKKTQFKSANFFDFSIFLVQLVVQLICISSSRLIII